MVRLQGAPRGAYYLYVNFGATLKAGKKTNKIVDFFVSEALQPDEDLTIHKEAVSELFNLSMIRNVSQPDAKVI